MVETVEQKAPDLRELKQQLQIAKDQRMDLVVKLGELAHSLVRDKGMDVSRLVDLSNAILHKDVLIYQNQNAITKLTANQHQCVNCQQPVEDSAKFCGNCGTLNANFKDPNANQVICNSCEQLIDEQHSFCPCCGVKQEGQ
ncbi:Double zinc ribbon protein OS=Ureibacillus acetophenoni OX=614649 GN=SAMN05877842_10443 PE=4 SV=1 [Ureibacillus acetophenoni]